MKSLNNFIQEKFKVSSKNIINTFNDDYAIVVPWGDTYKELLERYDNKYVSCPSGPNMFILDKEELERYKDNEDFSLYKIPKEYTSFDNLKDAWSKDEIPWDKIEKITIETFLKE